LQDKHKDTCKYFKTLFLNDMIKLKAVLGINLGHVWAHVRVCRSRRLSSFTYNMLVSCNTFRMLCHAMR